MTGKPWYKRYPRDFIQATIGMTLEEKGAYSLVLDLIYDRGGPVADDPRYIAGVLGCSVKKWRTIRESLRQKGKIIILNGLISNFRASKILEESLEISANNKINGAKGGQKTAQCNKDNNLFSDSLGQKSRHTCAIDTDTEKKENKKAAALAFDGKVVRLNHTDLAQWRKSYSAIPDMIAELRSLDDYFIKDPPRKNWFVIASNLLNKKHQELAAKNLAANPPKFRHPNRIQG